MTESEYTDFLKKEIKVHLDLKIEVYTNKLKEFQDLQDWLSKNQDSLPSYVLFNIGNGILKCPCPDIVI